MDRNGIFENAHMQTCSNLSEQHVFTVQTGRLFHHQSHPSGRFKGNRPRSTFDNPRNREKITSISVKSPGKNEKHFPVVIDSLSIQQGKK